MNKIVITTGDANGIGAEITLKALAALDLPSDKAVIISHEKLNVPYEVILADSPFEMLKKACEISLAGKNSTASNLPLPIVTAPVSKAGLHAAGHKFNGQTEVLEHLLGEQAEMLFVADGMRVMLLTRHLPLKDVRLTKEMVVEKVLRLEKFLPSGRFALCGFNPHAGEGGILGREEVDILIPAAQELRALGVDITDPIPADTLFKPNAYTCIVANYHDQGLIPIKTLYGMRVVNVTVGLPLLRTSPPHGTACNIAGQGIADPTGMIEAIKLALNS